MEKKKEGLYNLRLPQNPRVNGGCMVDWESKVEK